MARAPRSPRSTSAGPGRTTRRSRAGARPSSQVTPDILDEERPRPPVWQRGLRFTRRALVLALVVVVLAISFGGNPKTTSPNYVTCGNGSGAGSSVVYTLTGSSTGYDLTNIVVYGGWGDRGRDQQAYTVYYSTVAAPGSFISASRGGT